MGRSFETDMRGKMGERGGYLKVSQKRSLLEQLRHG